MNNGNHEKKHGHFFNGFLWGAALGGGIAYLLATKRGRELLRDLAEDGMDMLDDLTAEPEMAEQELSPIGNEPVVEETTAAPVTPTPKPQPEVAPTPRKRFFRARKK